MAPWRPNKANVNDWKKATKWSHTLNNDVVVVRELSHS